MAGQPCDVQLLRCFRSDFRISMDVYADSLGDALLSLGHRVDHFVPSSRLERFSNNRLLMRYLRYVHYPRSIASVSDESPAIQHVVDHGYAHLLPRLSAAVRVCNVHDLIPMLQWKGAIEESLSLQQATSVNPRRARKPVLNLHSLSFLRRYDHLITISESSAIDIQKHLAIPASKISVIPPVLSPEFQPAGGSEIDRIRKKYGLAKDRKWVMLSGREFYKNHPTALAAIKQLKARTQAPISIIKTGWQSEEFSQQLSQAGLTDCTHSVHIAKGDMAGIYSAVDCLLFPSLYEGFGMPVAEALACGTPAVVSNRASLPEVAKPLLHGVDAFDIGAMVDALEQALFDLPFRDTIAQQGPIEMQRYAPANIGGAVSRLYRQLLDAKRASAI
ncbi:glycosyltransferase family 4 protein [Arenicella xantha]|uniref:Glycosyltransferase involved in cell wall biosynthesis n=1 Tax=Arenicella xantha TaxID=644221 RepID=A0A395JH49_9GAMM|nr:glycosyltransferase family 1 protein [Arenicella xantha]RBP49165.1 glycosyltransferase involved in cell wall biosynthesis [Arenicella xantha]